MNRKAGIAVVVGLVSVVGAIGGVAAGAVPRAHVSFPAGPAGAASAPGLRLTGARIAPLSADILGDAKAQALTRFHSVPHAGLAGPLTLGYQAWQASSGTVQAGMQIARGSAGYFPSSGTWGLYNGLYVDSEGTSDGGALSLDYVGLTVGATYLVDCGVGAGTIDASINDASFGTLTVNNGHVLLGFQAPASETLIMLKGTSPNGSTAWWLETCTLHPVS